MTDQASPERLEVGSCTSRRRSKSLKSSRSPSTPRYLALRTADGERRQSARPPQGARDRAV